MMMTGLFQMLRLNYCRKENTICIFKNVLKTIWNVWIMTEKIMSRGIQFCPECGRQMVLTLSGNRVCGWCDYQDDLCSAIDQEDGIVDWREFGEQNKEHEVLE